MRWPMLFAGTFARSRRGARKADMIVGMGVGRFIVTAALCSCTGATPHPPQPEPPATTTSTPAPPTAAPPAPTSVQEENVLLQLGPYREEFTKRFEPLIGKAPNTLVTAFAGTAPDGTALGHEVLSYQSARGVVHVTLGFARRPQPEAHGETPEHVELLAEASRESATVAATLATLGQWMHSSERSIDVRFRAYEPVRIPDPTLPYTTYLLVPAADAEIASGTRVTVLRVIPAHADEYALVKMRGEGAARAWWHKQRGAAFLAQRWVEALARD